ncbi:MAG TPA: NADH-quinone oxidoreductase subunit C [Candidatus Omnitrophota bacterium]|nr:NADH-quinone oxidoreductase subunit C [Candidatus Omnitrophota bacterium]
MSDTENVKSKLEAKFDFLKDKVLLQRERRLWAEVPYDKFMEVFDHAVKQLGFAFLNTITGLDAGADLEYIYHLAQAEGTMLNLKTKQSKDKPIKTITGYFPSGIIYERELVDLLGAKIDTLPPGIRYPLPDDWPDNQYPLRKDWNADVLDKNVGGKMEGENLNITVGPNYMKEPSDFSIAHTNDVTIPIGPQHPALKEPESFSVALRGEKIAAIQLRLGYNHRGIEKGAEQRSYIQDVYLIERICGICSHSHSTAYVQAVEEIAGLAVPKRAQYIRTIIGELERVHSHLLWLGVAGHEIGFDTLLMYSWRDRESVMDILALITGNRVNYGMNLIGGVRRDITKEEIDQTLKVIDKLEEQTKYYIQLALEEVTLIQRLSGVGTLTTDDVLRLGAVGPTARASSVPRDVRRDDPYAAYGEIPFKVITDNHNDVYGRTIVRMLELMEAYGMIRFALNNLPDGPISVRAPRKIPAGEAISRYEAPRGEDVHYVRSNGTENPERVKVRAPTLANTQAVSKMLEDRYLADLPIVVAAIDPCFSCTDRSISVVSLDNEERKTMTWKQLRDYSVDWYKKQGVDFSKMKRSSF